MSSAKVVEILGILLAALYCRLILSAIRKRAINVGSFFIRHEITEKENPWTYWFAVIFQCVMILILVATCAFRLMNAQSR